MKPAHTDRGGTYYRVCGKAWVNPRETIYAKKIGGRWNPPGEFGALYLNQTVDVAAANARRSLALEFGDAVTFADVRTDALPDLQTFLIKNSAFADAVSDTGIRALSLPKTYPSGCDAAVCRPIARLLYAAGESGVAVRSAVAPGEELVIFDTHIALARRKPGGRQTFHAWYPGLS